MKKSAFLQFTAILCYCVNSTNSVAQLSNQEIMNLKDGKVKPDTSFIYRLPFTKGKRFLLIQAYNSKMSHESELSLDFKMKKGTKICAARAGVVSAMREDSDRGGLGDQNLNDGNFIIIRHADGSKAMYWHLQKDGVLVNEGDTVHMGQHIGFSGNTGYSAFPHLHFQLQDASGKDVPSRFYTCKKVRYLRPGKWYRAKGGQPVTI
jgi:hypothetical protein